MISMSLLAALQSATTKVDDGTMWLPGKHSSLAESHDGLFYFILWLSVFFFVLIVGLMVFFLVRYRRREGHEAEESPAHNTVLELTWSLIPAALLVVIFVWGFEGYLYGREAPANAYEVRVQAKKWSWEFIYPNGTRSPELHVPKGQPIRLTMTSLDVIHSLFLPTLRVKRDVVPGRYSETWFDTNTAGTFPLRCAEYCGTQHSDMVTIFVVHETREEFQAWLEENASPVGTMPPADAGKILVERNGCLACHSLDGSKLQGPTFQGIWGREERIQGGGTITVDANYVRESITQPSAKLVEGYQNLMPPYAGTFSEEELGAIIEYFKTIK